MVPSKANKKPWCIWFLLEMQTNNGPLKTQTKTPGMIRFWKYRSTHYNFNRGFLGGCDFYFGIPHGWKHWLPTIQGLWLGPRWPAWHCSQLKALRSPFFSQARRVYLIALNAALFLKNRSFWSPETPVFGRERTRKATGLGGPT